MTTSSSTGSAACQDPQTTTLTWVLLGIFLALACFSRILTILIFKGIAGACKSFKALRFERDFRNLFMTPTAVLLLLLFLQLAWNVAPWICALAWLQTLIGFVILCVALVVLLLLISRLFDFAEIFLRYFDFDIFYLTPLREGIRVAKLTALFFLGILFFSVVVLRIDPNNQFRLDLFFSAANFISLCYVLFFVPVVRDAIGGITLIVDRPFQRNDWIEIDGLRGTVERVGLFATVVRSINGGMVLIANSRFLECPHMVYLFERRRVVVFEYPLGDSHSTFNDTAKRTLIAAVERSIQSLGGTESMISFRLKEDATFALEVRFLALIASSFESEISILNQAIYDATTVVAKKYS